MSLRVRIALILAAVALAVSAGVATLSYLGTAAAQRDSIDDALVGRAVAVGSGPDRRSDDNEDGGDDRGPEGCPSPGEFAPATTAQIVTEDGAVIGCIDGAPRLPITEADIRLEPGETRLSTVTIAGEDFRVLSTSWDDGGTLQVARSLAEAEELLDRLRLQLAGLALAATAVAAALGWAVATALTRPIERLDHAAHRIATTLDLATPVDVAAPGEVGNLAASFSAMVDALGRSQDQQRRLVSDASHEMRTPLTSLRGNVEVLRQVDRLPVAERSEVVDDVLADVEELTVLLAELVDLASDLANAEPDEPMSLGDLARTAAARAERRTERTVTVTERSTPEMVGRPRQIERAVANLIDNGLKYSPPDTAVEVEIDGTRVTVRDRGTGIPPADLPHVFERFHRADEARTEPGSGLGLAIVEAIVRGHHGEVFAGNRDGGGAEVGFVLPTPDEKSTDQPATVAGS